MSHLQGPEAQGEAAKRGFPIFLAKRPLLLLEHRPILPLEAGIFKKGRTLGIFLSDPGKRG